MVCKNCGKNTTFKDITNGGKEETALFCSTECYDVFEKNKTPKTREIVCASCGKTEKKDYDVDVGVKYNCFACAMASMKKSERFERGINDGESRFSEKIYRDSTDSFSGVQ